MLIRYEHSSNYDFWLEHPLVSTSANANYLEFCPEPESPFTELVIHFYNSELMGKFRIKEIMDSIIPARLRITTPTGDIINCSGCFLDSFELPGDYGSEDDCISLKWYVKEFAFIQRNRSFKIKKAGTAYEIKWWKEGF